MKSFIEGKVKKRISGYRNENELIGSEYARENELGRSYKGREILELIQNAEDELTDNLPKEVYISFDGNVLSIANYGEPFSEEGITSLMYSNTSNKKNRKKKVIGNKGTGFRAILGWADEIRIDSADLHIKFSHKHAQDVLKNEVFKGEELAKGKKAATLVFPEWQDEPYEGNYTTEISLTVKKNERVTADIREQLENLNGNLLLFLNRTEKLIVNLEGREFYFEKKNISKDKIQLSKIEDGEVVYSKEWFLNRRDGAIGDENYSIVIAYDMDGEIPENPYIYTYFQTDVRFPFPVLLHADFNLNGDRNHLVKNDSSNAQILSDAAELLIDTAIKVYDKGVSYNRLLFLIPDEELEVELQRYDFLGILKEKMKIAELFPTVNSKYVAYSEDLKFYTSGLAKYLTGRDFLDLLMYSDYTEVDELLEEFSYSSYSYTEIAGKVKRWVASRKVTDENIRKIAYTAIQFLNEFENSYGFKIYEDQRPSFFFNVERNLIPGGTSVFLLDDEYEVSKPPKFAKVEFMDPYMRNYFYKRLKEDDNDEDTDAIIEKLGAYNVREFNSIELMDHMNDVIQTKIDDGKLKDARDRWKTLIKWLWTNRSLLFDSGESFSINFLTRNNDLQPSVELFYGKEYGNQLGEDLLGSILPEYMVCDISEYIDGSGEEVIAFLRLFGVSEIPQMFVNNDTEYTGYNTDNCDGYIRTLFSKLKYPITLDNTDVFQNVDEFCRQVNHVELKRTEIPFLKQILSMSSTEAILRWIRIDTRLQNHLFTGYENSNLSVQVIWGDRRTARPLATIGRPYSYIHLLFMTTPWVQVNGKRFKLTDCILGLDNCGVDLSAYIVEPDIPEYIKNIDGPKGKLRKEYQGIFEKLQVKRDIADLPVSKIYAILNYLPIVENSEEFARRLYNSIIDRSDFELTDADKKCIEFVEFRKSGKILTNNGFQLASESYYLDGKDVCDKVAKTYNLITIPKKRSKARIKELFGVDQLILIGEIVGQPVTHPENGLFANDLKQFKVMAFTYRIGKVSDIKKEARQFRELEINICTAIKVAYKTERDTEPKTIDLDDYEYILDGKNTYYLKVPVDIDFRGMKHNMLLASAVANIFSSYLDVSELVPRYRELYYAGNSDDRKALIDQEYEDEAALRKSKELLIADEDTQEEFVAIMTKLSGKAEKLLMPYVEVIDFEEFSAEYNVPPLIDILRYIGINVGDYNAELPPVAIDFRPYYESEVKNKLPLYREKYKLTWYNRLLSRDLQEQISLVANFLLFDSIDIRVENDVNFNVDQAIIDQLEIDENVEMIDLVALYNRNYAAWKSKQVDLRYIDEFMNKPDNMSLVYYAKFDELTKRYVAYCSEFAKEESDSNGATSPKAEPRMVEAFKPTTKPVVITRRKVKSRTTTGFTNKTTKKEQEKIGFIGEQLVYAYLLENQSNKKVEWVSENAKKAEINPEGGAGYGYDIEFVDSEGKRKYVEVKSSAGGVTSGVRFYMSDYEYKFGSEHPEDYMIYYVADAKSSHPQILIFDNVFNENHEFNKKCFGVDVSSEYTITAQAEI